MLGLIKALVSIQILILALMLGIMVDMLGSMIAAGLPVFLMLSLIPKVEDIANKMLDALPAILLLPVMSAIIIVVGAGSIVEAGDNSVSDEGMMGHVYTWITAVGVVFFAITLPTIMIPLLGSVSQMATQVVSSAVSTGTMVGGQAVAGAASGGMNAFRSGSTGGLRGLASALPAIARGGALGMAHGTGSANAPGLDGASLPNAGAIAKAAGGEVHASGLPPMSAQKAAAAQAFSNAATSGQTEATAGDLSKHVKGVSGWNSALTTEQNQSRIGAQLANQDYDKLSTDGQAAYAKWHGPVHMAVKQQGWGFSNADGQNLVTDLNQNYKGFDNVNDNMMMDRIMNDVATANGVEKSEAIRFAKYGWPSEKAHHGP